MTQVHVRFYQELNDYLPRARRRREFEHHVPGHPSVKDVIESLGVPHTEVDLIIVNHESVGFERPVADGDRISVYPTFEALDITPLVRLRPLPLRDPRFILDGHLGRLCGYLRLFGFDSLYDPSWDDEVLARRSAEERRILLTRDRGLLKRKIVTRGYCPRSQHPREQLIEVLGRFDLLGAARPLTRCMRCNGLLASVEKDTVTDRLPASVRQLHERFWRCGSCGQVYWPGSHCARLEALVAAVRARLGRG